MSDKTAVIIEGNRDRLDDKKERLLDDFYDNIQEYLESKGFEVSRDPGLPHTVPDEADLWIGHSRGAERLRFSSSDTYTIAFGSNPEHVSADEVVNHPEEPVLEKPFLELTEEEKNNYLQSSDFRYHFVFTDEMKKSIDKILRKLS